MTDSNCNTKAAIQQQVEFLGSRYGKKLADHCGSLRVNEADAACFAGMLFSYERFLKACEQLLQRNEGGLRTPQGREAAEAIRVFELGIAETKDSHAASFGDITTCLARKGWTKPAAFGGGGLGVQIPRMIDERPEFLLLFFYIACELYGRYTLPHLYDIVFKKLALNVGGSYFDANGERSGVANYLLEGFLAEAGNGGVGEVTEFIGCAIDAVQSVFCTRQRAQQFARTPPVQAGHVAAAAA